MDSDHDSSQYYIEDTLLLKFLLARYSEMLAMDEPKLVPVWAGLGLVALHQNRELANAFETLISSNSYTVQEILTSSVDLFLAELHRLATADTSDYVEKRVERRPLSRTTARKFLFWAWSEGRKMGKEQNFRFYPIWELVTWLALGSGEYFKEFEKRCRFSEAPAQKKIQEGSEIIKATIFKRNIESLSFRPDMLSTGAPLIDKETRP